MNIRHYLRMARWARNPPSAGRVKMIFAILIVCIVVWMLERWLGWPDALTPNYAPKGRVLR
ncbi:hypothetical protein FAP39_07520 [Shimia litoralis]|uniref:Uncharacterized protein n=1 Tax=Shimia litoralis TaxID=420403 RepID=A0A4U7N5X7_9RHOB|nr:hypothetical protein [Shimia litoralis]TKZ21259.1 hypothetical protein FAP39_07520 [Shimia litoralis]